MSKARFQVNPVSPHVISGLGTSVEEVVDTFTLETVAYIGDQEGRRVIHFIKTISLERFHTLAKQFVGPPTVTQHERVGFG